MKDELNVLSNNLVGVCNAFNLDMAKILSSGEFIYFQQLYNYHR